MKKCDTHLSGVTKRFVSRESRVELIIMDEAERLSTLAVEYLRDILGVSHLLHTLYLTDSRPFIYKFGNV